MEPVNAILCLGYERVLAERTIKANHYTHSVPSGKSFYFNFGVCVICFSIPANKNIASFLLWPGANVWELTRMWAPDGHERNLLTRAISFSSNYMRYLVKPDALVSYADPMFQHTGHVYKAASWIYSGQSSESRRYRAPDGNIVARRAFHSGTNRGLTKAEIEAKGYVELKGQGKHRYVFPVSKKARKLINWGKTVAKDNATVLE